MTPMFVVSGVDGAITGPGGKALSCEVVDQEGRESDSFQVVVDDRDGATAVPQPGDKVSVSMGYKETGVVLMGTYTIESVVLSGWPQMITVHGTATDLSGDNEGKTQRSQDYHDMTVSQIIGIIAKRMKVAPGAAGSIAGFKFKHFAQTEESDIAVVTRLGVKFDAVATVKKGILMFVKKGEIPVGGVAAIYGENIKAYQVTLKGRPAHGETQDGWFDKEKAERVEEKVKGGTGAVLFQLGGLAADGQSEAKENAKSRSSKNARDEAEIDVSIIGDPGAMAEGILTVVGVRADVDGAWHITEARHIIDNNGYETTVHGDKK